MSVKKLKISTLLFHSIIVIGAGHGIGVIGIFDVIGIIQIPEMIQNGIKFNFNGEFQGRLSIVVIFSLIGKLILITSLILKKHHSKNITAIIGLIFLWISVYMLTSGNWYYDSLYAIAFWTSTPFLISSIFLAYYLIKSLNQNLNIKLTEKGNE